MKLLLVLAVVVGAAALDLVPLAVVAACPLSDAAGAAPARCRGAPPPDRGVVEFDRVARPAGIVYWMDAGTLLGAYRDQKLIAWDDDLDVCIPHAEFERLWTLGGPVSQPLSTGQDLALLVDRQNRAGPGAMVSLPDLSRLLDTRTQLYIDIFTCAETATGEARNPALIADASPGQRARQYIPGAQRHRLSAAAIDVRGASTRRPSVPRPICSTITAQTCPLITSGTRVGRYVQPNPCAWRPGG